MTLDDRAGRIGGRVGIVVSIVVVCIASAPAMWSLIGNGTVIALAAFVLVGLAIGHVLGGPVHQNRTALAIATATRHLGIALIWIRRAYARDNLGELRADNPQRQPTFALRATVGTLRLTCERRVERATGIEPV